MKNHVLVVVIRRLVGLGVLGCVILLGVGQAYAHSSLSRFIEHHLSVSVGPRYIDISLDLTFYHPRSALEREKMDQDRDGTISNEELRDYQARLSNEVEDKIGLLVDGKPVPVVRLYEPEVLLDDRRTALPGVHVLRVHCFARTPSWAKTGSRVTVEDRFWPEAPALQSATASAEGGVSVLLEPGMPLSPARSDDSPRLTHLRCLVVPPLPSVQAVGAGLPLDFRPEGSAVSRGWPPSGAALVLSLFLLAMIVYWLVVRRLFATGGRS